MDRYVNYGLCGLRVPLSLSLSLSIWERNRWSQYRDTLTTFQQPEQWLSGFCCAAAATPESVPDIPRHLLFRSLGLVPEETIRLAGDPTAALLLLGALKNTGTGWRSERGAASASPSATAGAFPELTVSAAHRRAAAAASPLRTAAAPRNAPCRLLSGLPRLPTFSGSSSSPTLPIVGIHVLEAPVLHPMSEGLFNFVIGWTVLFAPLLFTDCQRDRYKGSLDLLWGFQMFLTNTFLIPYMAIRLNDVDFARSPPKQTQLGLLMTDGAPVVGIVGGVVCLVSIFWALFGRSDAGFGGIADRWSFLESYIGSERLAYAFIWDICLYALFQPWLIGDNLQNIKIKNKTIVSILRFIPVVGLVTYLLFIDGEKEF